MKWTAGLTAAIPAALFAACTCGCGPKERAEANNRALGAKTQFQAATANARRDLANDAVSARVKAALLASNQVDASSIGVRTNNGTVYLRGTVPTAQQKQIATRIARDTVASGMHVQVQLQVATKPGTGR